MNIIFGFVSIGLMIPYCFFWSTKRASQINNIIEKQEKITKTIYKKTPEKSGLFLETGGINYGVLEGDSTSSDEPLHVEVKKFIKKTWSSNKPRLFSMLLYLVMIFAIVFKNIIKCLMKYEGSTKLWGIDFVIALICSPLTFFPVWSQIDTRGNDKISLVFAFYSGFLWQF